MIITDMPGMPMVVNRMSGLEARRPVCNPLGMTTNVGILAYGSLLADPRQEIGEVCTEIIQKCADAICRQVCTYEHRVRGRAHPCPNSMVRQSEQNLLTATAFESGNALYFQLVIGVRTRGC